MPILGWLQGPDPVDIDLMYSFGRKSGLPLQTRFRTVRHVQKGDKESFGRLEMERDGTQQGREETNSMT